MTRQKKKQEHDSTTEEMFDKGEPNRTPSVLASEILRLIKEKERTELLFVIVGNANALRFCAAWAGYPVKPKWPIGEPPVGENEAYDWLWTKITNLDLDGLAMRANIPPADVERVFELCRAARAIFPDGTIATAVREILRRQVEMYSEQPEGQEQ